VPLINTDDTDNDYDTGFADHERGRGAKTAGNRLFKVLARHTETSGSLQHLS
jgi:hypothetical protein